ncbi:hypothetical protein POM88_047262 [Heracleum sosnowskyi]|uniref:RNase H type-1 domain-containing protein n=1 Tax=Heracleum sosnowskyi TaxID=360622 RepID=A0AAD8GSW9_9APIA|nr:hypothetical protein POM88_047262 [Heracleum sosnowskyi]
MSTTSSMQPTNINVGCRRACQKPTRRWKINASACVRPQRGSTSVACMGAVIRDANGNWLKGIEGLLAHGDSDLLCAELLAIERVLEYGWELQKPSVVLETDCLLAIKAIDEADEDHVYHRIIQNIRFFIHNLPWNVQIKYIKNETNQVASFLAHKGKFKFDRYTVHDKPPQVILR